MTPFQVDRLIGLLERFVFVEETKLRITAETIATRNALEERNTSALEKQASGFKVDATHKLGGS